METESDAYIVTTEYDPPIEYSNDPIDISLPKPVLNTDTENIKIDVETLDIPSPEKADRFIIHNTTAKSIYESLMNKHNSMNKHGSINKDVQMGGGVYVGLLYTGNESKKVIIKNMNSDGIEVYDLLGNTYMIDIDNLSVI